MKLNAQNRDLGGEKKKRDDDSNNNPMKVGGNVRKKQQQRHRSAVTKQSPSDTEETHQVDFRLVGEGGGDKEATN